MVVGHKVCEVGNFLKWHRQMKKNQNGIIPFEAEENNENVGDSVSGPLFKETNRLYCPHCCKHILVFRYLSLLFFAIRAPFVAAGLSQKKILLDSGCHAAFLKVHKTYHTICAIIEWQSTRLFFSLNEHTHGQKRIHWGKRTFWDDHQLLIMTIILETGLDPASLWSFNLKMFFIMTSY